MNPCLDGELILRHMTMNSLFKNTTKKKDSVFQSIYKCVQDSLQHSLPQDRQINSQIFLGINKTRLSTPLLIRVEEHAC